MDENSLQLVLLVLIGVVYAVVAVVKKIDKWIQTHRFPRDMREPGPASPAAPSEAPSRPPSRGETPAPRPRDVARDLMRELERAFGGVTVEEAPSAPPIPVPPPPPPGRPAATPVPVEPRDDVWPRSQDGAPSVARRRSVSGGSRTEGTAQVQRRQLGHLAALRSRDDLRRGVLVHEILGPPKSLRRHSR
ncbi:hypothetical protein JW916_10405 [Candidatus Sumerlaeota bacterium]|nr:hypothetical protein [Candidatus Sumerlaeota bacterium]